MKSLLLYGFLVAQLISSAFANQHERLCVSVSMRYPEDGRTRIRIHAEIPLDAPQSNFERLQFKLSDALAPILNDYKQRTGDDRTLEELTWRKVAIERHPTAESEVTNWFAQIIPNQGRIYADTWLGQGDIWTSTSVSKNEIEIEVILDSDLTDKNGNGSIDSNERLRVIHNAVNRGFRAGAFDNPYYIITGPVFAFRGQEFRPAVMNIDAEIIQENGNTSLVMTCLNETEIELDSFTHNIGDTMSPVFEAIKKYNPEYGGDDTISDLLEEITTTIETDAGETVFWRKVVDPTDSRLITFSSDGPFQKWDHGDTFVIKYDFGSACDYNQNGKTDKTELIQLGDPFRDIPVGPGFEVSGRRGSFNFDVFPCYPSLWESPVEPKLELQTLSSGQIQLNLHLTGADEYWFYVGTSLQDFTLIDKIRSNDRSLNQIHSEIIPIERIGPKAFFLSEAYLNE